MLKLAEWKSRQNSLLQRYHSLPQYLRHLQDWLDRTEPTWGYTIYCTTYTPQSDAAFPGIFDLITSYIKSSFYKKYELCLQNGRMPKGGKAFWDALWAKYQPRIINDATRFDGASIDNVRSYFEACASKRSMRDRFPSYRMFIVVDEECLQTLLNSPIPEDFGWNMERWKHYVKLVEAWQEHDPPYMGWMKCSLESGAYGLI